MTDTDKKTVKQAAFAHFKAKMAGELRKFHVEEWNCDIYHRATSTMATEAKMFGLTQAGKTAEALVESIVQKALDENGNRVFHDTDRIELMNQVDPNVLIKVASQLNNASAETVGDIEKN